MRAVTVKEYGQTKVDHHQDMTAIGPGPGEVKIRMRATGVCHSDLSARDGILPASLPIVLGHEGAGEVIEIGEGVTGFELGDHVVAVWVPPCRSCPSCLRGQPNLCMVKSIEYFANPRFSDGETEYFGISGTGTFAEEAVMPAEALIPIPDDVPWDVAALIGCGVVTGVGAALNTAQVEPGSSVAIIGCGGVGIAAMQGARICGAAEIVAIDLNTDKLETAKRFGATHGATPDQAEDLKNQLTGGEGFDYVFEVVGRSATIRQAYDLTRRGGTCVVVGAGAMDDMVSFSAFELFYMEKKLLGSIYGSADVRREFPRLINLWRNGRLDLEGMITRRLTLDDVDDAFAALQEGSVVRQVIEFP